jgi:hypothetical protein
LPECEIGARIPGVIKAAVTMQATQQRRLSFVEEILVDRAIQ